MSAVTVETLFNIPDKVFRFYGFSLLHARQNNQKTREKILYYLSKFAFWFYVIGISFIISSNIIHDVINPEKQNHEKIPYFVNVPFVVFKIITIFIYKREISEIIIDFKRIFADVPFRDHQYKHLRCFIKTYKIICYGTIIAFIVKVIGNLIQNGVHEIALENTWVPINSGLLMNIPIVYTGIFNLIITFSCEVTIAIILTLIAMSFNMINDKIQTMNQAKEFEKRKLLKDVIELQTKCFLVAENFQKYFSSIFFILFIQSSISICIAGFEIMTVREITNLSLFILFLITTLLQIFYTCLFGQRIIDSSQQTARVAYENNWYEIKDIKFKKALLLLILRSQKHQQITAKGFVSISLTTFMQVRFIARMIITLKIILLIVFLKVLKTSYSYLTLLKRFYSD